MPLWLAALLAAAGCGQAAGSQESSAESRSKGLVETLRRQLMRDNSDYSLETPVTAGAARERAERADSARGLATNYYVSKMYQGRTGHDYPFDHEHQHSGNRTEPELPVSKKDLLYYIDDDQLVSEKLERTYKTLKGRRQFRRSGQNVFIQEEGPGAVAVVSLGRAPVPAVRLPHSRRQYRRESGLAADEEELPPPATSDREGLPTM